MGRGVCFSNIKGALIYVLSSYSSSFYNFNLSVNLCITHNSTFQCSPNPYNILHPEGMRAYPFVFIELLLGYAFYKASIDVILYSVLAVHFK
jgi:hypothetical protein